MFKKLLILICVFSFFFLPFSVFANDLEITCFSDKPPEIVRNTDPLFEITGFLPGSSASRTVFVKNTNGENDCRIFFRISGTTNILTHKINVHIPNLFNNSLTEYLKSDILMADLQPEQEITRTITMSLPTNAGNVYTNQKASFDITVHSEWGAEETGEVGGITDTRDTGSVLGMFTQKGILPQTGQNILLIMVFSIFFLLTISFVKLIVFNKRSLKN